MKALILILICAIFLLNSCNKKNNEAVICTEVFASVTVTIKNGVNAPIELDSFKVIRSGDNVDMTVKLDPFDFNYMQKYGSYPITNDNFQKQLFNKNMEVVFMGSKDGKIVVNQKYTIGADECHVKLIAGNREVIVK